MLKSLWQICQQNTSKRWYFVDVHPRWQNFSLLSLLFHLDRRSFCFQSEWFLGNRWIKNWSTLRVNKNTVYVALPALRGVAMVHFAYHSSLPPLLIAALITFDHGIASQCWHILFDSPLIFFAPLSLFSRVQGLHRLTVDLSFPLQTLYSFRKRLRRTTSTNVLKVWLDRRMSTNLGITHETYYRYMNLMLFRLTINIYFFPNAIVWNINLTKQSLSIGPCKRWARARLWSPFP